MRMRRLRESTPEKPFYVESPLKLPALRSPKRLEESPEDGLLAHVRRLEAGLVEQSRSLAAIREEMESRDETASAVRLLASRLDTLEQGEAALESRLKGMMASTATVVEGLKGEVARTAQKAEEGTAAARAVWEDLRRALRTTVGNEAATTRLAVATEAQARQNLGEKLERHSVELVEQARAHSDAVRDRVDAMQVELGEERQARVRAVDAALDAIEHKWVALARVRAADLEEQQSEADALRASVEQTDERVDGLEKSCARIATDLSASLRTELQSHMAELCGLREKTAAKLAEIEDVLSSESSARRASAARLASRLDEGVEHVRGDLVTATNRLGSRVCALEAECDARFDMTALQLRNVRAGVEAAVVAAAAQAEDLRRAAVDVDKTARVARQTLRVDAQGWCETLRGTVSVVDARLRDEAAATRAASAAVARSELAEASASLRAAAAAQEASLMSAVTAATQKALAATHEAVVAEAAERRAADLADATAFRDALTANDATLRGFIDEGAAKLKDSIDVAQYRLAHAITTESQATMSSMRAIVDAERADRTAADNGAAATTSALVATLEARMMKEHAERAAEDAAMRSDVAIRQDVAGVLASVANTIELRTATDEVNAAVNERASRCEVSQTLDRAANALARAAVERHASELASAIDAERRERTDSQAEIGATMEHRASELGSAIETERRERTDSQTEIGATMEHRASELSSAIETERRERTDSEAELGARMLDENYARDNDLIVWTISSAVVRNLVDVVADTDEQRQVRRHVLSLSNRVDNLQAEIAVDRTRQAANASASAALYASTTARLVRTSANTISTLHESLDNEVEARLELAETTRRLAETELAEAVSGMNNNLADTESRLLARLQVPAVVAEAPSPRPVEEEVR